MATTLATLTTLIRRKLQETSARFWTDAEIVDDLNAGIKDLWGAITLLNEDHYLTINETTLTIAADATAMTGVPTDCFRIHTIEPKDLSTTGSVRGVMFVPKKFNHPDFVRARGISAVSPNTVVTVFYRLMSAGPPIAAPVIMCAPRLTLAIPAGSIRIAYIPTIAAVASGGNNPIPGESDNALVAWGIAYGRVKERDDRSPDPNWLATYATEKQHILNRIDDRDDQEGKVTEGIFEPFWEQ